jgi:hypothetical protein
MIVKAELRDARKNTLLLEPLVAKIAVLTIPLSPE